MKRKGVRNEKNQKTRGSERNGKCRETHTQTHGNISKKGDPYDTSERIRKKKKKESLHSAQRKENRRQQQKKKANEGNEILKEEHPRCFVVKIVY